MAPSSCLPPRASLALDDAKQICRVVLPLVQLLNALAGGHSPGSRYEGSFKVESKEKNTQKPSWPVKEQVG